MLGGFGHGQSVKIPLDSRFGVALIWLTAVVLLAVDTRDGRLGLLGAWALLIGMAAAVCTVAILHAYSRRVILEVMSWEHRQQMSGDGDGDGDATLRLMGRAKARPPTV